MLWRLLLDNLIFKPIAMVLLIPLTLYATATKAQRLSLFDGFLGCEEDGWNGNGVDPNNPRQFWIPGKWGQYTPNGTQGWWPDYKRVDWDKLSFLKQWWLGYQWCALRNVTWNLRLIDWYATSIHKDDIKVKCLTIDGDNIDIGWVNKGKKFFFKRKDFGKFHLTWGWEFYPYIFDKTDPQHARFLKFGYVGEYKYKTRSVPSIRFKLK